MSTPLGWKTQVFDRVATEVVGRYQAVHLTAQAKAILKALADEFFATGWVSAAESSFAKHQEIREILRLDS